MTDSCNKTKPKTFAAQDGDYADEYCIKSPCGEYRKVCKQYTIANGVLTQEVITLNNVVVASLPTDWEIVDCPEAVEVVDFSAALPISIQGVDCSGAAVTATGLPNQIIQTVPHPKAVQPTSLCPNPQLADILAELKKPRYDIEVNACNDGTDDWLLVIDKNELVTGLPTLSYTNLTTGVTQATRPANLQCASPEEIELVETKGCLNGVTINGYQAIKDRATTSPSIVWTLWQDPITGVLGAAPTGMTIGECVECKVTKQFEFGYYHEIGATVDLPKINGLFQGINADFTQPIAGLWEAYLVVDGVAQLGNGAGASYGAEFPLQFTSLQGIADFYNNHPANTAPKDVWIAGADYLAISNTANGALPNHQWSDLVLAHYDLNENPDYQYYKGQLDTSTVSAVTAGSCRKIEILKTIDCNDALTLKGFELGGAPITGFDTANIVAGDKAKTEETTLCVTMLNGEKWNVVAVVETSPCGDKTTKYMDMGVFPPVDVTANVATIDKVGCCPCVIDVDPDTTANIMEKTGAANFKGALVINAALLLSTAPAGAKLRGVDIQVRKGAPTIRGSLSSPAGATSVVANASYTQTWSSSDPAELDDFTYTLANGDEVDVFWVIKL